MPLLSFSILSCLQQQQQQQQPAEKKKIKIKPKVVVVDATTKTEEKQQECHPEVPTTEVPTTEVPTPHPIRKKIIIIKKQHCQKRFSYNDIVPPASMIYTSQNNFYYTPPPPQRCCRFFIENKHCFLRESDNTCISPTSRTVIGFWNGGVGKECKLLPIQDETTYEQEIVDEQTSPPSSPTVALSPPSSPTVALSQPLSPQPSPNTTPLKSKSQKSKPRFVSDAQRARIASEPVALLREKLAKQYGMRK